HNDHQNCYHSYTSTTHLFSVVTIPRFQLHSVLDHRFCSELFVSSLSSMSDLLFRRCDKHFLPHPLLYHYSQLALSQGFALAEGSINPTRAQKQSGRNFSLLVLFRGKS